MKSSNHIIIIGSTTLDIKGKPFSAQASGNISRGEIYCSSGGVGKNIAQNLANLKIKTTLISSFSNSIFSNILLEDLKKSGVNCKHCAFSDTYPPGIFITILGKNRDLRESIIDVSVINLLTPEFLNSKKDIFRDADYIVAAGISVESLEAVLNIAQENNIPVIIDPAAASLTAGLKDLLGRIWMITPNKEEAEILSDMTIDGIESIENAADKILDKGLKHLIITLGAEGVYYSSKERKKLFSSISTIVKDCVGAGDAFISGLIYGLCTGKSWDDSVRCGIASSTINLTTYESSYKGLTPELLEKTLKENIDKI